MKKSLTFLSVLFVISCPSVGFGDWLRIFTDDDGNRVHMKMNNLQLHKGNVFYWVRLDFLQPVGDDRIMSRVFYNQGNCETAALKNLSLFEYKFPGGKGNPFNEINNEDKPWRLLEDPKSAEQFLLAYACNESGYLTKEGKQKYKLSFPEGHHLHKREKESETNRSGQNKRN